VNFADLFRRAANFKKEYPRGKLVALYLPELNGNGSEYKERASEVIEEVTGMKIPASPLVPSKFYEEVLGNCVNPLGQDL